ncbi:hypothetical protein [Thermocatellispora tengchongensis]|uniref:hypothetical protein n=1 Tax=Thermocatellispora tengchongensis TaxID=1073253 RepID=UPI0036339D94
MQDTPAQDAPAQDTSAQDTAERDTAERDRQERSEPGARDEPGARPYRWSAALHGSYDSSGAPYAPRGPYAPREPYPAPAAYQPLDPRRRAPYHSPYAYAPPVTAPRPRQRRPKSYIGTITVLLAIIVGGIVMAAQSASGQPVSAPVVGGAVLLTIGAGLLVATWFGRGAGLVVAGALVTLGVVASSTVTDVPRTVGSYSWSPVTVAEAMLPHRVGIGEGNLDLTDLELPPGSRVEVSGSVSVGEFTVTVPPDVRVAVRAKSRVGDVKIEHSVRGGPEVSVNTVLEPEVRPRGEVATIVLDLRAGVGDVEVRRAA